MEAKSRQFEDSLAKREQVPLLIGLVGPSGSGKTFSALRLATGIQRVSGGEIYVIDTESRRALHYADRFNFRHLQFDAPFSPLDYLAAIDHCVKKGAKTLVIDSMSHEHEGPGGVKEWHDDEVEMMSGGNEEKAKRVNVLAWAKPKAARRRLINAILQHNCNYIFCFRAQQKLKMVKGGAPEPRGWQPITDPQGGYNYEMTLGCLLLPASDGVPTWQPEHDNEGMIKLPAQFLDIFKEGPQLSEYIGEKLGQWAAGGTEKTVVAATVSRPATPMDTAKRAWAAANPGESREVLLISWQAATASYFGDGFDASAVAPEQWAKFVADGFKK